MNFLQNFKLDFGDQNVSAFIIIVSVQFNVSKQFVSITVRILKRVINNFGICVITSDPVTVTIPYGYGMSPGASHGI